ncbi:MAG: hypothetical protein MR008_01660 [Aerococcus sp.]|nr:hypothetical protein [Aerococcus sp.]
MTGIQIWLLIALIADTLLLISGVYLYRREQKTRYLIALFMGALLLVVLAVSFALTIAIN